MPSARAAGDEVLDEQGAHPRWCSPSATAMETSAVFASPASYSAGPTTRPRVSGQQRPVAGAGRSTGPVGGQAGQPAASGEEPQAQVLR